MPNPESTRTAALTKLSNREITVLRWTAGEISAIMNITERTVNFHIKNAANKTSAAVKANAGLIVKVGGLIAVGYQI